MNAKRRLHLMTLLILTFVVTGLPASAAPYPTHSPTPLGSHSPALPSPRTPTDFLADDPGQPAEPVKLIFVHHSCGENWLADSDGGLGIALRDNNYFVSDTNYGWGPACPGCSGCDADHVGSCTDIGHWWEWFRGANSATFMEALYTEYGQHSWYSRLSADPGGENKVIMFKSCYPNSHLAGPQGPPTGDPNPLQGQPAGSEYHTVANAKGVYNDLLTYFATRQDKLFVLITAPPLMESETDTTYAANARAFNDWLVDDWLDSYPYDNVAVFDFYNLLTSNGGDPGNNDLGSETGNHHRWWSGAVQHIQTVSNDYSAYWGGSGGGSHPTAAGNQKATAEFVPLLNVFYNRWQGSAGPSYTFNAIITPTNATPPITYTWSSEHLVSGQGTASATYRWDAASVYEIRVEAENCGGTFTDTHTITIGATLPLERGHSDGTPSSLETRFFPKSLVSLATRDDDAAVQQTMVFQDGVGPEAGYAGTRDVVLAGDVNANANLGGLEHLQAYYGDAEYRRSLMRWDLSALPCDITINAATVELYRYHTYMENDTQLALYRVTSDWAEGTGTDFWPDAGYTPDGATWLTATLTAPWVTPGGDYDATALDQLTIPTGMGSGWVRLDATDAVRAWAEGSVSNDGLLLRPLSGEWTDHHFYSREAVTPTMRPRLVVTYTSGSVLTSTVHLPVALMDYAPEVPSCPYPLTGVIISGPTSGSISSIASPAP
jgi:hypothetical protein